MDGQVLCGVLLQRTVRERYIESMSLVGTSPAIGDSLLSHGRFAMTSRLFVVFCFMCFNFLSVFAQAQIAADPFAAPPRANTTNDPVKSRASLAGMTVEQQIRQELNAKTSFHFIEEPLQSALQLISEQHGIPIVLNGVAMESIGLTTDAPVSLSLKNVSLRSFLKLALRDLELTYMIRNEVLQITTVDDAEENLVMYAYTLPEVLADKSDQVLEALYKSVQPDTWMIMGGPSSASMVGHVLVVSTTDTVHESVVDFIDKVQAAFERHTASK